MTVSVTVTLTLTLTVSVTLTVTGSPAAVVGDEPLGHELRALRLDEPLQLS